MATGNQSREQAITAKDVEFAERRAAAARERAAHAGLSAARSFEEWPNTRNSRTYKTGASSKACLRLAYIANRRPSIAKQRSNRKLAELKRKESEADLAVDADS